MDAEDFRRLGRFLGRFYSATGKRIVMWQIPLGNTKMRAVEQHVGPLSGQSSGVAVSTSDSRSHLLAYRDAGIVAFLFGGGASGTTCACNGSGDGVTNPAAINGNNMASEAAPAGTAPASVVRGTTPTLVTPYAADDDGGFFRWRAYRYYQDGPTPLGASTAPPSPPTNVRIIR